jgi:hypothetical protein
LLLAPKEIVLLIERAGRVVWFAPFSAMACEALTARSGLLPLAAGVHEARRFDREQSFGLADNALHDIAGARHIADHAGGFADPNAGFIKSTPDISDEVIAQITKRNAVSLLED